MTDSELNEFVLWYLSREGYENTFIILEKSIKVIGTGEEKLSKTKIKKFNQILKSIQQMKPEQPPFPPISGLNLTFDITAPSSITRELVKNKSNKSQVASSSDKRTRPDKKISIKFIRKLEKLGIPKESASDMTELNVEWDSILAKNKEDFKIHCTHPKCKYRTHMVPNSLREHCISVHEWGEYKCPRTDNCQYTSHTKVGLNRHIGHFHKIRKNPHRGSHHCRVTGCSASFQTVCELKIHEDVHNNTPRFKCIYCQYTSGNKTQFSDHLTSHYGELEYICKICGYIGTSKPSLLKHEDIHSENKFRCTICSEILGPRSAHNFHASKKHDIHEEFEKYRILIPPNVSQKDMEDMFPNRKKH